MSDVVYSVEVQYLTKGNFDAPAAGLAKLHSGANNLHSALLSGVSGFTSSFSGAIESVGREFISLGATAAAAITGVVALGMTAATKAAFNFNEEMETTTISLASIADSTGLVSNMAGGMRVAADVLKDMRTDAARLPGEFKDLADIMQTIASPMAQMGHGLAGSEKLAAQVMSASVIKKVPIAAASRETAMMLEGAARHNMPFFNRLALGDARHFNALDPSQRYAAIKGALDKLNPAMDYFSNSWTGIKTTAMDGIRQAVGNISGPLFQSVKGMVQSFNNWSNVNKDQILDWEISLGNGIDKAFHRAVDAVKHWYPIIKDFTETMYSGIHGVFLRVSPLIETMLGKIETFMKDPGAFDKLASTAKDIAAIYVTTKAVGVGAQVMGAGASAMTGLSALGGTAGAAGGLAAVGAAAIPLSVGLAAAAVGAYGVYTVLTDITNPFHNLGTTLSGGIVDDLEGFWVEIKGVGNALKPLASVIGTLWLTMLKLDSAVLHIIGKGIGTVTDFITGNTPKLNSDADPTIDRPAMRTIVPTLNAFAEKERERAPTTNTYINHVEIKVNSNQDPNRIAKRTVDIINDLRNHPKIAQLTGAPVYSR